MVHDLIDRSALLMAVGFALAWTAAQLFVGRAPLLAVGEGLLGAAVVLLFSANNARKR